MCELLALNSNVPVSATFSFAGLSARGGLTGHHVDGWGIGFHDTDGCRVFIDAGRACDAPLAEFLRRHPPQARIVVGHIRKATQGAVALANCHPFQRAWRGRHWLFCHNGHLEGFDPPLGGRFEAVGTTDSELAFCWLLQEIDRLIPGRTPPGAAELADALADIVPGIAEHGTFNCLLSDGSVLVAHCGTQLSWLQRRHPFGSARLLDRDLEIDLARFNQPGDHMVVVATAPLTQDEAWQAMAPGELRIAGDGQLLVARQLPTARNRRHALPEVLDA